MMTVRCPSCFANLKVNPERIGSRTSAKCPGCHSSVPLTRPENAAQTGSQPAPGNAPARETLVVTCQSCKTRLKAPISRTGTKSTCPKCRATVLIEHDHASAPPSVLFAAAGADPHQDEVSSASTRRIDSRMIGMMTSGKPAEGAAGVDLEAFLKSGATGSSPSGSENPVSAPSSDTGSVAPLLKPPVAAIEKIASEIRQVAENLTMSPAPEPAGSARTRTATSAAASPQASHRASRLPGELADSHPSYAYTPADDRLFPSWRGLLSGGIAGLVIGAAQAGVAVIGFASFLPPLPFQPGMLGMPEAVLRIVLLGLLGAMSGFIAGAVGSPRYSDCPLSLIRCGGMTLLTGLAWGLVGGLVTGAGVQVWPIAGWMRDLLLVGLLTPALNRLMPPRT